MNPKTITLKITDMHCVSCAINIDFELEDLDGVKEAKTHYAQQTSVVTYDPHKTTDAHMIAVLSKIGYHAVVVT